SEHWGRVLDQPVRRARTGHGSWAPGATVHGSRGPAPAIERLDDRASHRRSSVASAIERPLRRSGVPAARPGRARPLGHARLFGVEAILGGAVTAGCW